MSDVAQEKKVLSSIHGAGVSETRDGHVVGLYVCGEGFTDVEMEKLLQLKHLVELQIDYSCIGREGIESLQKLRQLRTLWFNDNRLGDSGVACISQLTQLENLSLRIKDLTNKGLSSLSKLYNLRTLTLSSTNLTDDAINTLRLALPNCTIRLDD